MDGTSGTVTVLHVDDDPDFADLTARFLERQDDEFDVLTATSADEGWARLTDEPVDCVVSDYEMPETNGIEFLRDVRDEYPELPFILYTGQGSEAVASDAISAGVTDYMQKVSGSEQYEVLAQRVRNSVARHRVQEIETRSSTILDASPDPIIVEVGRRIVYANPAAVDLAGGSDPGDLIGVDITELTHPDDVEAVLDGIQAVEEDDAALDSVTRRVQTLDGDPLTVEITARSITWQGQTGHVIIVRDTTERQERQQELDRLREKRERSLERIVQRTRDLIDTSSKEETARVAVDIVEDVLDAPLAGIHLLSEDREVLELIAAIDEVREEFGVPPEYRQGADHEIDQLVWEVFQSGDPRYIHDTREYGDLADETPARSGLVYPLGEHGVLITSATEPDGFDETDRNYAQLLSQTVTAALDRVEREAVLRDRNRQLERLHRAGQDLLQAETPEAVADRLIGATNDILDFPIGMVRYYDESEGGLVPVAATDTVEDVFDSRTTFKPSGDSLNWSAYESGTPTIYDDISDHEQAVDSESPVRSLMILPLGEHGTLSAATTEPNSFDEGDVYLARLLVTTAELALSRLEHEAELVRQRDELDRQNERLNQFASTLSHDLRNPLSVATGRLELLAAETDSQHVEALGWALDRMDELIEDVLTLARAGEALGTTQAVDLSDLVTGCWQTVDTQDLRLEVHTDRIIDADETRLRQLFENLMRNAIEHGEDATTITVGDIDGGFYFEDDGTGISADEREKVFEAGYTTMEDGSGFGLNIVREIAEAHDWRITVTEGTEGGARFEVTGVEELEPAQEPPS